MAHPLAKGAPHLFAQRISRQSEWLVPRSLEWPEAGAAYRWPGCVWRALAARAPKADCGRGVKGRKNGCDIETTAMGGEHEQGIPDGIQDPGEHHQRSDCHPRQERLSPQSHQHEQHTDGAEARSGQRPEGGGGIHAADEDEEAAKATPRKPGQSDSPWWFFGSLRA